MAANTAGTLDAVAKTALTIATGKNVSSSMAKLVPLAAYLGGTQHGKLLGVVLKVLVSLGANVSG